MIAGKVAQIRVQLARSMVRFTVIVSPRVSRGFKMIHHRLGPMGF
jgi:hypothetical protein